MTNPTANESAGTDRGKRVLLAKPRGYCAGVDRAVQTGERARDKVDRAQLEQHVAAWAALAWLAADSSVDFRSHGAPAAPPPQG